MWSPKPFLTKQPTIDSNNCQEKVRFFFFFFGFSPLCWVFLVMDFSAVYCKCIVVLQLCTVQYWTDGQVKTSQSFACSWCLAPLVEMWAYLKMKKCAFMLLCFFLIFCLVDCFFFFCDVGFLLQFLLCHCISASISLIYPLKTSLHFNFFL